MAVSSPVPGRLVRWAADAPIPVHVAVGHGGDRVLVTLRADDRVEVVATPRHASVLVVAGHVPTAALAALHVTHDTVPAPRASVVVGPDAAHVELGAGLSVPRVELVDALVTAHRDVLAGRRDDPAIGPADNPVDWQGVGPHGQGGEGMMGGVPWGRPMAMPPVDGRDGLALDRLGLRLGPFLGGLPPLLVLRVGLQGDVLEDVAIDPLAPDDEPYTTDLAEPGDGADASLVALAELLALVGLRGLARRTARLATASPAPADIATLRRRLDRRFGLRLATDGVGRLDLPGLAGDVTDRWRRWLERAAAAVEGDLLAAPDPVDLDELGTQLEGMELGAALLALASVRPELAAATLRGGVAA